MYITLSGDTFYNIYFMNTLSIIVSVASYLLIKVGPLVQNIIPPNCFKGSLSLSSYDKYMLTTQIISDDCVKNVKTVTFSIC